MRKKVAYLKDLLLKEKEKLVRAEVRVKMCRNTIVSLEKELKDAEAEDE